jgi:hypothetical protein
MNFSFSDINAKGKGESSQAHTLTILFYTNQENKKEKGNKHHTQMTGHPIKNCKDIKQSVTYTQKIFLKP